MLSPRAPLFSVSLAFAIGCVLGIDGWFSLSVAIVLSVLFGALWFFSARRENVSLAAFYVFTASIGLVHTLILAASIPPNDLRLLPDEKTFDTTQWRGLITAEPAQQTTSAHATRRTLDRTNFTLHIESWRPTGGRFFGADIDTPWQPATGDIQCTVTGPAQELLCGDRLEFAAALEPIPPPLCPGSFDAPGYYARQGIFYETTIAAQNWKRIESGSGNWWQDLEYRARDWAYARLQIGLEDDPRMADFLAGMLIGYRQEIPADIEQDFRRTGTLHVFAVSGQNIAEMVVVALILLQLCGLVRWRWAWIIVPIVLLYCLLTGSPGSAVRATIMAVAVLLAWRLGRPLNALGCWSLAFIAMMVWDPTVLLDPGAQLSFAIVLGLILIAPPITRLFMKPFQPDPFLPTALLTDAQRIEKRFWWFVLGLLGTGIAAVLVTEPITAITFHQITPISIVANLVVVPVAGLITMIGTLSVVLSLLSTFLAGLLNNTNWLLAKGLILFVGFLAHEPGASLNVADLRTLASPTPSFIVAPLQDSACLLVRTPDQAWLINTGRESATPSVVWHLLQYYGINRLDGVVLAQMATPDNSGAAAIVRDFRPRQIVVPILRTKSPLEKSLPELLPGAKIDSWQAGQTIPLGSSLSVEVLHPSADDPATRADDRGLILLFHSGDQTLLFAGRAGDATLKELATAYPNLRADVLVMGTEPSPDSTWLESLQVRDWLQIPQRNRLGNSLDATVAPDACQVWNLTQTGAVDIHFQPGTNAHPPEIHLRPWLALPTPQ